MYELEWRLWAYLMYITREYDCENNVESLLLASFHSKDDVGISDCHQDPPPPKSVPLGAWDSSSSVGLPESHSIDSRTGQSD